MSAEITTLLNLDFHDMTYKTVNAKQYDRASRFILVTCCNRGKFFFVDNARNAAFIRYRKTDDLGVFNTCKITEEGKVLIELTEQMLAVSGSCYADLIILNEKLTSSQNYNFSVVENDDETSLVYSDFISGNNEIVTVSNFGEIITNGKYSILSSMTFCINVVETTYDNIEIESSYEYDALNDLLIQAHESYISVITECKKSETNAKNSENNARISRQNAKTSENNAKASETNAKQSENNAAISEMKAKTSETNAKQFEQDSLNYATLSQSYAVGGTNTRTIEDIDNAKYYYQRVQNAYNNISGIFTPMGSINFSELSSVEKQVGYVYHIKDSFVTDETFKCGADISCLAGTNVYYTGDGYWDCFNSRYIASDEDIAFIINAINLLEERYNGIATADILEINI